MGGSDQQEQSKPIMDMELSNLNDSGRKKNIEPNRDNWSSRLDYILSMVGYCVGFGNLWRFPYVCNRNGGGAFLIPFLIFLLITGLPMFYLETSLGQFSGKGPVQMWSFCPMFRGVGIGISLVCFLFVTYYNIYLAWPIYYMIKSCSRVLPWTTCNNSWNTKYCVTSVTNSVMNSTTYNSSEPLNKTTEVLWRNTTLAHTSAEEFWQYNVLNISEGINHVGSVQWPIVGCMFASYVIIYLSVIKGVRSSGKVVYVTATLPYLLLIAIFIRTVMQPGAVKGVLYFVTPDFNKLLYVEVWIEACVQVFYSLGPGWGAICTAASYNKFHEPCLRQSVLLSFVSEGTSVLSGLATFSVLGVMAERVGVPIFEVVSSGPGLGFITYPQALAQLPLPQLWSFIFFLMLLTIGLDSQFMNMEVLTTVTVDQFPRLLQRRRYLTAAVICCICFLLGILFCTQGGQYIFQLLDWYISAICTLLFCLIECIASVWIYGLKQFSKDVEMMSGKPLPILMRVLLAFVTPITLIIAFILTLMKYKPPKYGNYVYPNYAVIIGWIIAAVGVVPLPVFAFIAVRSQSKNKSLKQRISSAMQPDKNWQPMAKDFREKYKNNLLTANNSFRGTLSYVFGR